MNNITDIHLQNHIIGATIDSFFLGEPIFRETTEKAKTIINGQIKALYFRINANGGITSSEKLKIIQKLIFEEKIKEKFKDKQVLDMLLAIYEEFQ